MDTGNMTFGEILFNGRYHIIGGVMFLVFMVAFMREVVSEVHAAIAERRRVTRRSAYGMIIPDVMLGATMTDGGEAVEEDPETKRPQS
jgi:hypothetical protein